MRRPTAGAKTHHPYRIVGIDDASSGPTTLRATLSRSSPWDTPRMSAILGADEHDPFAFPIGVCGSQGLTPPPETSTHPSGFSLRSQQDFPGFNPQTINGSLSYPRCHGVQFRRTGKVYHIFLPLCGGIRLTIRQPPNRPISRATHTKRQTAPLPSGVPHAVLVNLARSVRHLAPSGGGAGELARSVGHLAPTRKCH